MELLALSLAFIGIILGYSYIKDRSLENKKVPFDQERLKIV